VPFIRLSNAYVDSSELDALSIVKLLRQALPGLVRNRHGWHLSSGVQTQTSEALLTTAKPNWGVEILGTLSPVHSGRQPFRPPPPWRGSIYRDRHRIENVRYTMGFAGVGWKFGDVDEF
jgi:hypothetical protein